MSNAAEEPESPWTIERFLAERFELPESGQWAELEQGRVLLFQPPDLEHGNAILNLSKAIAAWTQDLPADHPAAGLYACFDLGLELAREPDTLRFPAVSFFAGGERFAELDKESTTSIPALVVELASSADRRERSAQRVREFLEFGVAEVWIVDPRARSLDRVRLDSDAVRLGDEETLEGASALPDFSLQIGNLFAEPTWWRGSR